MNYFEMGNKLYKVKDYLKAIDMYKKCASLNENTASSLYNASVCYIKLKDYENAIELLKKAINIKKESKYFFNLGYCYSMLNDNRRALIYFNTAWSLNNDDKDCEKAINLILNKYKIKSFN